MVVDEKAGASSNYYDKPVWIRNKN